MEEPRGQKRGIILFGRCACASLLQHNYHTSDASRIGMIGYVEKFVQKSYSYQPRVAVDSILPFLLNPRLRTSD